MYKQKTLILSSVLAAMLFQGCSMKEMKDSWEIDKELNRRNQPNVVVYDEAPKNPSTLTEHSIVNAGQFKSNPYELRTQEVIVEDPYAKNVPPKELLAPVAPAEFYNRRIGDIIRVLTSNLEETSVVYEPNVQPDLVTNIKTGKMKLFDLLKTVVESVGYYMYYDDRKKAVVVAEMKEMKYYIPAGIFVDRSIDVTLGNAKGDGGAGSSGKINLNANNPVEALTAALDSLGSKDKIYTFDKDTGLLVVKEHAIYIPEITKFVYDFTKDRSRKFIVDMSIVDVTLKSDRTRTLDIASLVAQSGKFSMNLLTGAAGMILSPSANSMRESLTRGISIESVISLINAYANTDVVQQSKSVVANHSVKYMAEMSEQQYVSKVTTTKSGSNNDNIDISTDTDTLKQGIQFTARIDAYNKKDYIDVSIAPTINYGSLQPAGVTAGVTFYNKLQQVREMLSTATIRSGDIIVVGGLIKNQENFNSRTDPLTESWTPLGSKSVRKDKTETIFIVKVTELTDPSQTFSIPTRNVADLAEEKVNR